MQTLRDIAPWLALSSAALALALLVLGVLLWTKLRAVQRAQTVVMGPHDRRDIVAHSEQLASQVRNLRQAVEDLNGKLEAHKRRLEKTLTHRALVRYDAFRDAGGEQSATLVLLDDHRSGFVVSAIAARDFARVYVKTIEQGVADRELSPEERRAVVEAVPEPLPPRSPAPSPATQSPERPAVPEPRQATSDRPDRPAERPAPAPDAAAPDAAAPPARPVTPPVRQAPLAVEDDFVWESPGERGGGEAGPGQDQA